MTTMMRKPDGIAEAIRSAQHIALTSHVHPDGDTLGSALALAHAIRLLGKDAHLFCDDPVPQMLRILPGSDEVCTPDRADAHYDLLVVVDTADQKRMGSCASLMEHAGKVVQIDHHGTNPGYAEENDVDPDAPATGLLIRELIAALGIPLNREIAMCLYAAIATDTGNLSFASTTEEAFRVLGELMAYDLPMSDMNRVLFRERTPAQAGLLGCALSSMRYFDGGRITLTQVTLEDMARFRALDEDAEGIVNFGLDITGVKMTAFIREMPNGPVKTSLRAVVPYTVDQIARQFGGGGHTQAAGCTMHCTLAEAAEQLISVMHKEMHKEQA